MNMNQKKWNRWSGGIGLLLTAALALAACQSAPAGQVGSGPTAAVEIPVTGSTPTAAAQPTEAMAEDASVTVSDQEVTGGSVVIEKVVSQGPGWLVIHTQQDGKPGPVLGYAAVQAGENEDVAVQIDADKATPVLYAMLHVDAGEVGTYEFPGEDKPAAMNGQMVNPSFQVSNVESADAGAPMSDDYGQQDTSDGATLVKVGETAELGPFLVDEKGLTLYLFTRDTVNKSNCFDGCLEAWPPLLTEDGEVEAGEGVTGELGVITREDGTQQVTYDGMPLYYYVEDQNPGDTLGQGIGDVWFVVEP